ncbi:MAG: phosphoadenosine phosphosulfate reductase family protein [Promethearchaeota archaeon]
MGKIKLFWCDSCHVPLIREKCSSCENRGRKVSLSPPGDVRPAFDGDLKRIVSVISSQFGDISAQKFQDLVENQILLLNKVPYVDRMDEIIFQGEIIGIFRFNIVKGDFELLPRISLAIEIWNTQSRGWVAVDEGAKEPIIKGASVLSPGVVFADETISINDPVIIVCDNEVIAVGLAKKIGSQMGQQYKGVAVKTKYRRKGFISSLKSHPTNWNQIITANQQSLEILEKSSIEFIERIAQRYEKYIVAYSGGKDSLVTLNLVEQSNVPYDIIFSDTGLEYPETLENIGKIEEKYKKRVIIHKNDLWDFWERFNQFGPPSRNSRWCCKSAKLSPVNEILEIYFPENEQVLCYLGRRRYESLGRSREPQVSKNPWVPKQVIAAPINNWNAFEVFLYIQKHDLTAFLNPLYYKGFIRIGCWVCPASSLSDFEIMKESHPKLIAKLNENLFKIKDKYGFPEHFILWGLWRWKFLPRKVLNLLKTENVAFQSTDYTHINNDDLAFRISSNPSPCIYGGFSALLSANQMLDLSRIKRLMPILGKIQYNMELGTISIKNKAQIDVFCDGSILIRNKNSKTILRQILQLIRTLYRVIFCDGCGTCTYACTEKALVVNSGVIDVLEDLCNHCLKCNDFCPLLKYFNFDSQFFLSNELLI